MRIVFLAVSLTFLVTQTVACVRAARLLFLPQVGEVVHRGVMRTIACRIVAACVYTGLAVAGLAGSQTLAPVGVYVFTFTQSMWLVNSLLDLRLHRRVTDIGSERGNPPSDAP